jgi:hypothetical protein
MARFTPVCWVLASGVLGCTTPEPDELAVNPPIGARGTTPPFSTNASADVGFEGGVALDLFGNRFIRCFLGCGLGVADIGVRQEQFNKLGVCWSQNDTT